MDSRVREVLNKVASTVEFVGVKFGNVNATNAFGDNALHSVCSWGDVESATMLIDAGIDIDQFGDRGVHASACSVCGWSFCCRRASRPQGGGSLCTVEGGTATYNGSR